jgi:hypothetical protein
MNGRRTLVTVLLAAAAVALMGLHQHLIDLAALGEHGVGKSRGVLPILDSSFYLGLPYRVVDPEFGPPQIVHGALFAVALAECGLLYALYRTLSARAVVPAERAAIAVAALAMLAISLSARSVLGFDLYAYAGFAKLGLHAAYAPPPTRFPGDFAAINEVWAVPMIPSPYGPLWIAILQLVDGGARSLHSAVLTLRLLALVPFAAIAALLARGRGLVFAALFALDPSVDVLYVANGHNDLFAVAPLVGALLVAPAAPLAAAALAIFAGLVKLPYAGGAFLVFAYRGPLARRALWVAVTVIAIAAGSFALGGPPYLHELLLRVKNDNEQHGLSSLTASAIRAALFVLVVVALLTAFVRRRIWRAGSLALVASSSTAYPWYLMTGLVYACLERGALVVFLVLFPAGAALLEFAFPHLGLGQVTMLGIVCAGVYQLARRQLRPIDDQTVRPGP